MVTVGGAFQPVALSCPQKQGGYSEWQIYIEQQIGGRDGLMRQTSLSVLW